MDDWELIEEYRRQGTRSCLDELVVRDLTKVRALIYPMVGQSALADDLTQETFFRAVRKLHTFQGKAQFGTWLARVAINVVREHHRHCVRHKLHATHASDLLLAVHAMPERNLESNEALDEIQAALFELPEAWREAVSLVYIQGFSANEAAQICECTVATLYWRIHQSRKRLKQRLADYL